ncbi:hypothetical protein [Yoonia sp. SS1-5]|uniref:Uncharacterized protein n=1 Tax=Yoonia rhodophyticola TaxID=3137370 RepID=A0AAN0MEX0_9RHOB
MPTLSDILTARCRTLLNKFHLDDVPPLTATDDLEGKLTVTPYGGGTLRALPGRRGPVIWDQSGPHGSSLWVPKSYEAYRAAFFDFIALVYGPDVDMAGKDLYDVDHIFNRARAPQGFFVRVEAVVSEINQSHGRTFEKTNTNSLVELARRSNGKDHRKMTFISALKLANLDPPRNANDAEQIAAITQYFTQNGWPPFLITQALDNLIEVAQRR